MFLPVSAPQGAVINVCLLFTIGEQEKKVVHNVTNTKTQTARHKVAVLTAVFS